jgi:Flp pilus assembly pilin Flp
MRITKHIAGLRADRRGVAAIEFAIFAGLISIGMLNVTDIAVYVYQRMQVEYATQAGAQAAWHACDINHLPATTKCSEHVARDPRDAAVGITVGRILLR